MTEQEAHEKIEQYLTGTTLKRLFNTGAEMRQFYELINSIPSLSIAYAQAQQAKIELYADETVEIADNEPDPQRARVMVDARKWIASKIRPEKYGDRIDLNITQAVDISKALSDAKQRVVLSTCYSVDTPITQRIETIEQSNDEIAGSKPVEELSEDIFS